MCPYICIQIKYEELKYTHMHMLICLCELEMYIYLYEWVYSSEFFLIVAKYTCCTSGKETACQCRRCGFEPRVGEIPSREGMASQSSILAWRIQWTVECDRLQSIVLQRVRHD